MKKLLFLIAILSVSSLSTQLSGQTLSGVLYDNEGDDINNEEIVIEIKVCADTSHLFTKIDTVMTSDYGIFSSDLTDLFKQHPAMGADSITYSIKFTYRQETIETEKKKWTNVRFANQAGSTAHADHALTSDVSNSTLKFPALSNLQTDKDGVLIVGAQGGTDEFKRADINYDGQGLYTFELGEDPALSVVRNLELQALTEAMQNTPPDNNPYIWTFSNDGNSNSVELQHHWMSDVPDYSDFFNVSQNLDGDPVLTEDQLAGQVQSSPPGHRSVFIQPNSATGRNDVFLASPLAFTDTVDMVVTTFLNPPVKVQTTDGNILNIVPNASYTAMGNKAACFQFFFENGPSPLIGEIYDNKSNSFLAYNSQLWSNFKNSSKESFEDGLERNFPDLVRYVDVGSKKNQRAINYSGLIPLLSKAIDEQNDIIQSQQKQIDELKTMVEELIKAQKQ